MWGQGSYVNSADRRSEPGNEANPSMWGHVCACTQDLGPTSKTYSIYRSKLKFMMNEISVGIGYYGRLKFTLGNSKSLSLSVPASSVVAVSPQSLRV